MHEKLLLKLDQEGERTVKVEENLTLQAEALKNQNKEENHARMILQVIRICRIFKLLLTSFPDLLSIHREILLEKSL